mgnify:CR=1 FL=1|jgi:hypothetical protein
MSQKKGVDPLMDRFLEMITAVLLIAGLLGITIAILINQIG